MTWRSWLLRSWRKVALAAIVLAVGLALLWPYRHQIDWAGLIAMGRSVPAGWFIAAFLVLPVFGFPISVLLVLAGARFGTGRGMLLATAGVFFHHFAVHRLAHGWLRERLAGRIQRAGLSIPQVPARHRVWFTALFAAIQGPPYSFKLYLLALTDIPFPIYLLAGAPIYSAFCLVPIGAGSAAAVVTPHRVYLTLGIVLGFMLLGRFLKRRFGKDLAAAESPGPETG